MILVQYTSVLLFATGLVTVGCSAIPSSSLASAALSAPSSAASGLIAGGLPWTVNPLGYLMGSDVAVSRSNPAGVNLGAVMESIVRADSLFLTQGANKRLELSGSNAVITINSPNNGGPVKYNISLNTLTSHNFSDVALWPNAIGQAILMAGYPTNADGSLAAMSIRSAIYALGGLTLTQYPKGNFITSNTMISDAWVFYDHARFTKIWETPNAKGPNLKGPYAYTIIAMTESQVWLSDPSVEETVPQMWFLSQLVNDYANVYMTTGVVVPP